MIIIAQNDNSQHLNNIPNQQTATPKKSHMLLQQSSHPNHSPSSYQNTNLQLSLKQKKKQIINSQKQLSHKIKQYFSDLTVLLHDRENSTIQAFQSKIYNLLENIDYYCAAGEVQRVENREEIFKILNYRLEIVPNHKIKQYIENGVIDVCFQQNQRKTQTKLQHCKTSKKASESQFAAIKQAYMEQLAYLEQKIQKLTLKQEKIKLKIGEMESRHKMKKLGNAYLPTYQQKSTPNLLVQRLESQNKILKQQIADCSQKILSLRSQNSLLMRDKDSSQILPTQKKRMQQSINLIEESIQISQYQSKISLLQSQIQSLKTQILHEQHIFAQKQQQMYSINQKITNQYQHKIQDLTLYRQQIETQCQKQMKKRVEIQQKNQQLQKKSTEQSMQYQIKCKQFQNVKEMYNNMGKLLKIKQQKLIDYDNNAKDLQQKLKQSEDNYKVLYVESNQKIQQKQISVKTKQLQIQSIKSLIKKQQAEKIELRDRLAEKQEEIYTEKQKYKILENQITKLTKEKESYAKKEVTKAKKQLKKFHEDEKNVLIQDFKVKYGECLEKLQILKRQFLDNKDRCDKKVKVYETRMEIYKQKTAFQMKQMLDKVAKAQKDKIIPIIESYVQNEASISLKTAQIKMFKQQIASLKKPTTKKQVSTKPAQENEVKAEMQQFEKKLWQQKLEIQKQIYEGRLTQMQEESDQKLLQKSTIIQNLTAKVQSLEKSQKQLKSSLSTLSSGTTPQISQLRKINEQMSQKQQRLQSQLTSTKNNLTKVQNQCQQMKQQLKLKKQIIAGLKKDVSNKQMEKNKLNQALTSLMQQMQKMKKNSKEANKKQAIFEQFKGKLISQTQLSDQICQLRLSLQQKTKQHKLQLNKKDQIIRQLKMSEQLLNRKVKNTNTLEDQISQLKQKMKKMKIEIDRKDTLVDHLKDKHEKTNTQLATIADSSENELRKQKKQLQNEKSKTESLKLKLSKLQTNCQLIKLAIVKIYQQSSHRLVMNPCATLQKQFTTHASKQTQKSPRYQFTTVQKTPQPLNTNIYKQALSILQISSQDLQVSSPKPNNNNINNFNQTMMSPGMQTTVYRGKNAENYQQNTFKLARLLESQEIDVKAVVAMFQLTS